MLQFITLLMLYAMAFIGLMVQTSEAKYPVAILDQQLKFSPRLFGVSTVVYNNEMYAYGGQTGLSFNASNNMYKYNIDLEGKNISMETVTQKNPGPNCTSCGAVMISEDKMLLLTQENASNNNSAPIMEVVKPYTFDLKTKEWSVPPLENLPRYDASQQRVFTMRKGHKTILGSDGCVYVVGGLDFFNDSSYMHDSWYYDPVRNEYDVLSDNRPIKSRVQSSLINLPDGNIGVLFGYNEDYQYFTSENMSVIDIQTKTWLNDYVPLSGDDGPVVSEEITVQVDKNNSYAYFFGGRLDMYIDKVFDNTLKVLDLSTNGWIETVNQYEFGASVKPRYFASSAIINDTFITVFGTEDENNAREMEDLDIALLPEELRNRSDPRPQNVTVKWISAVDQTQEPDTVRMLMERHRFYISISISTCLFIYIVYFFFSNVSIKLKAGALRYRTLPKFEFKHRRPGALVTTETSIALFQVFCVLVFGAVLGYLMYNTANSSISTTEELEDVEYQIVPDIRFCYSGYDAYNESIATPRTECRYEYTEANRTNCTNNNIMPLSNLIHMPSFPQQLKSTTCYMYKSLNESTRLSKYNPTIQFSHVGGAYTDAEVVFIQFYEPNKNPNRVLFLDEDLNLGIDAMDAWKNSERIASSSNDVMNHILLAYPESDISIQYEIVHKKELDVDNVWNALGVFPIFKETTELFITHNDAIDRGRDQLEEYPDTVLGTIRVTPNSFKKKTITEKRDTTVIDLICNTGGICSFIFAVYALLFGAQPFRPWGIVQKAGLIKSQEEKKFERLGRYFNIPEVQGVPLVSPVHQRYSKIYCENECNKENLQKMNSQKHSSESDQQEIENMSDVQNRLRQLEGRSQILELVLKAYYFDDEIFYQLNRARENSQVIPDDGDLESGTDTICNNRK